MKHFMRLIFAAGIGLILCNSVAAADDLSGLSTVFNEQESLAGWSDFAVSGWAPKWEQPAIVNGELVIRPHASIWFEDLYGGFLYREVTGNFIVTTRLRVQGVGHTVPLRIDSTAGLMARARRSIDALSWKRGAENWLFFFTGSADRPGTPQFETKTTTNSVSTLKTFPAKAGWVYLRLAREGEVFTMLYRYDGAQWNVLDEFVRPDLPETLEVGFGAHTNWEAVATVYPNYENYNANGVLNGTPDVVLEVKDVRFRRPERDLAPHLASMHPQRWADYTAP